MNKKTNGYGLSRIHTAKPAVLKTKKIKMPKINSQKMTRNVSSGFDSAFSLIEIPYLISIGVINLLILIISMFGGDRDE